VRGNSCLRWRERPGPGAPCWVACARAVESRARRGIARDYGRRIPQRRSPSLRNRFGESERVPRECASTKLPPPVRAEARTGVRTGVNGGPRHRRCCASAPGSMSSSVRRVVWAQLLGRARRAPEADAPSRGWPRLMPIRVLAGTALALPVLAGTESCQACASSWPERPPATQRIAERMLHSSISCCAANRSSSWASAGRRGGGRPSR